MYTVERIYYSASNETRVKLEQKEPLRIFEVMLEGDISELSDETITSKALDVLAREIKPNKAIEDLFKEAKAIKEEMETNKKAQDDIMLAMTEMYETLLADVDSGKELVEDGGEANA